MFDYNVEEEPILLSKPVFDLLLKEDNPSDLIALYSFYYYTAKWQKTQQPKCTIDYVSKKLNMSEKLVRLTKHKLMALGLIEDVKGRGGANGENIAWYIKVKFIWTREKAKEAWENKTKMEDGSTLPNCTRVENNHTRNGEGYALSSNSNALSSNSNALNSISSPPSRINRPTRTKPPEPIKEDIDLPFKRIADHLRRVVSKHYPNNVVTDNNVKAWLVPIKAIFRKYKMEPETIVEWLRVYYDNFDRNNTYHPVIRSGESLKEKIDKLEGFVNRVRREAKPERQQELPNIPTQKKKTEICNPNAPYRGQQLVENWRD